MTLNKKQYLCSEDKHKKCIHIFVDENSNLTYLGQLRNILRYFKS